MLTGRMVYQLATDLVADEPAPEAAPLSLLSFAWDGAAWNFEISANAWLLAAVALIGLLFALWRWWLGGFSFSSFEVDQADIGIGENKLSFRPNSTDRQVAYAVWVELSTRKIGLPIDLKNDVISEIYDSWYSFFSITRDLLKTVPVSKVKRDSTQKIIKLSMDVLNLGLRPHLTEWQARFRRWNDRELARLDKLDDGVIDLQDVQNSFPQFEKLSSELMQVNEHLIKYRKKMHDLIMKD